MWIIWAIMAAISAALVTVLTKAGLKKVDSSLAFAIQSVLIFCITWGVVTWQGTFGGIKEIEAKAWILLLLAGLATTLSTLFSFKALSIGQASYVTTIERSSVVVAILLSVLFLKEKITWQLVVGAVLIISGAVLIALSDTGK
ncbi:EamA family transporter [Dyadobacter psychrotolerans]|uniref:EamA family transporter n=1 Tax=Dyadobacter psychrotolerans TaxID=2541721 RepID=A0A4R5DJ15_9BACT|nr:EamA family transporter [Dyadobacter psychrotolerans]TDE10523.1 EamA family transporter [Dyadobacter psychrotolerans]